MWLCSSDWLVQLLAFGFVARRRKAAFLPPRPPTHWPWGPIPKEHITQTEPNPFQRRKFEEWIQKYGPVISFQRGREVTVIIGRYDVGPIFLEAAVEIMEKEGVHLADRPPSIAAGDTLSGGMRTLFIKNGERLRKLRKACTFLLRKLQRNLMTSSRYAASVIMSLTYGKPVLTPSNDPIVREVNASQARLGAALVPGTYMVDAYPWLRYVPGDLSELRRQHQIELTCTLFKSQLESVRAQLAAKKDPKPCFARTIIERQDGYGLSDNEAAYLAGSMFGAGAGTSSSAISIVIMAAAVFPETQHKVQEQLDTVIASGKHESDLVQVTAFYWGSLRPQFSDRSRKTDGFSAGGTADFNGYVIPTGASVYGCHWPTTRSIARDPVVFPDPERFDPQRWITADGKTIREDLKVFQFGFGRRVSLFINTALLLWAFHISQDKKKSIDTLAFTNTANTHPLPFAVHFEPRRGVEEMAQLLKEA
ncbi:cytochrome P450 [Mycena crocata]|nr:cytochrome P450 [Mycena crocata]